MALLQRLAIGDFAPDLTMILDLPVAVGLARAAARAAADRFEGLDRRVPRAPATGFSPDRRRQPAALCADRRHGRAAGGAPRNPRRRRAAAISRWRWRDGGTRRRRTPRTNPDLVGHEAAEATLRRLCDAGRLPHAVLLTGPRGIGKATLAFRLARYLLAPNDRGPAGAEGARDPGRERCLPPRRLGRACRPPDRRARLGSAPAAAARRNHRRRCARDR